jgi:hypothetical protein
LLMSQPPHMTNAGTEAPTCAGPDGVFLGRYFSDCGGVYDKHASHRFSHNSQHGTLTALKVLHIPRRIPRHGHRASANRSNRSLPLFVPQVCGFGPLGCGYNLTINTANIIARQQPSSTFAPRTCLHTNFSTRLTKVGSTVQPNGQHGQRPSRTTCARSRSDRQRPGVIEDDLERVKLWRKSSRKPSRHQFRSSQVLLYLNRILLLYLTVSCCIRSRHHPIETNVLLL